MGVLDRFEKGIERAVNGAFAKAFRSEVQPVEIASALRKEVDDKAAVVGRDRTIAPNTFVVELGAADHQRLGQWTDALGDELGAVVNDHARQQRYAFVGPVTVTFEEAEDLDTGVFRVRSTTTKRDGDAQPGDQPYAPPVPDAPAPQYRQGQYPQGQYPPSAYPQGPAAYPAPQPPQPQYPQPQYPQPQPQPQPQQPQPQYQQPPYRAPQNQPAQPQYQYAPTSPPVLDVDGVRYELTKPVLVIGRGTDADVVLDDPGVSRRHAEIHLVDGRARIIDLGSTNGTFVDGEKQAVSTLREGSSITIGRTRMTFHAPR